MDKFDNLVNKTLNEKRSTVIITNEGKVLNFAASMIGNVVFDQLVKALKKNDFKGISVQNIKGKDYIFYKDAPVMEVDFAKDSIKKIINQLKKLRKQKKLEEAFQPKMYYLVKFVNDRPIAIYGQMGDFDMLWYKTINFFSGFPVDVDGNVIDSLKKVQDRMRKSGSKSFNGLISLTKNTDNYKTNKDWYAIIFTDKKIKKDKNYEEL
jgi:hypothetical protein